MFVKDLELHTSLLVFVGKQCARYLYWGLSRGLSIQLQFVAVDASAG